MTDLYFVFIGKKLPDYTKASLELATRYSGLTVNLIAEKQALTRLNQRACNGIPLEDFYSKDKFADAAKRVFFDGNFRNGFWLKTLERLFVLEQFMTMAKKDAVFHAELDQILFRVDKLIHDLGESKQWGVFVPFADGQSAIASVFFCNDRDSMRSLTEFASTGDVFPSEMALLARWAYQNPDRAYVLPTIADHYASNREEVSEHLSYANLVDSRGIVDGAQLGHWVGGYDPRNVRILETPKTRFIKRQQIDLLSANQLSELSFHLDKHSSKLSVHLADEEEHTVYNLHLHSKVHPWLLRREHNLEYLLRQASKSGSAIRIPGTRKSQIKGFIRGYCEAAMLRPYLIEFFIRRNIMILLRRRPVSYPFISGDGFRKLANHVWEKSRQNLGGEDLRPGDIVFCEGNYFETFKAQCLPSVSVPFVLLLGNSDVNYSSSNLGELTENPKIRIFAQNLVEGLPNVSILPIGLENAWWAKNGQKRGFHRRSGAQAPRLNRIMWSFKIETNVAARTACANAMLKSPVADSVSGASPFKHRKLLGEYAFVASPRGNGEDTHRMWEAMYLGCVPIVLRSHMTEECERLGLPVWIVDDYQELSKLTEEDLAKRYEMFNPKFETRAIWHDFWQERIAGASDELAQVWEHN